MTEDLNIMSQRGGGSPEGPHLVELPDQDSNSLDESSSQPNAEGTAPFSSLADLTQYTDQMFSDSVMTQYQSLVNQQAQAAAAMMILGPSAAAINRDTGNADISLPTYHTMTQSFHPVVKTADGETNVDNVTDISGHMISELSPITQPTSCEGGATSHVTVTANHTLAQSSKSTNQTIRGIRSHKRSAKDREEKYKCSECSYRSKWSHGLSNHMRTHNNTVFKCEQCDYSTPWKGDLTNHRRMHTGNLFQCEQCSFKTYRKQGLEKHMILHTGNKPFQCTECSYCTSQPGNLKKHAMRHTGEKPISCEFCSYRCRQTTQLKQHVQQHHVGVVSQRIEGGKPKSKAKGCIGSYSCARCGYSCMSRLRYTKHMHTHHNDSKPFRCGFTCLHSFSSPEECEQHRASHSLPITNEIPVKKMVDASTNTELSPQQNETHVGVTPVHSKDNTAVHPPPSSGTTTLALSLPPHGTPSVTSSEPHPHGAPSVTSSAPPPRRAPSVTSSAPQIISCVDPNSDQPCQFSIQITDPTQSTAPYNIQLGIRFGNQSDSPSKYVNQSNTSINYSAQNSQTAEFCQSSEQIPVYGNVDQSLHSLQSDSQSSLLMEVQSPTNNIAAPTTFS